MHMMMSIYPTVYNVYMQEYTVQCNIYIHFKVSTISMLKQFISISHVISLGSYFLCCLIFLFYASIFSKWNPYLKFRKKCLYFLKHQLQLVVTKLVHTLRKYLKGTFLVGLSVWQFKCGSLGKMVNCRVLGKCGLVLWKVFEYVNKLVEKQKDFWRRMKHYYLLHLIAVSLNTDCATWPRD